MKSILYVGATLMIGASIYGFVDYKQSNKQKEFKSMYTEKKHDVPAEAKEASTVEPETKKAVVKRSPAIRKSENIVEKENVIEGVKPVPADQKIKPSNTDLTGLDEVTVVPAKENKSIKAKKRKKISSKLFSRAPLREDIEDEDVITPAKKSVKKIEIKE